MARLQNIGSGEHVYLRSRHLVGRSRLAHLQLSEPRVSGEHAVFLWTGNAWELHDLGSRNGTFIDGDALKTGGRTLLEPGMSIGFGHADGGFWIVDIEPPSALAVVFCPDGANAGPVLSARSGILALPSPDEPEATVYRGRDGDWLLDEDGERTPIRDGAEVTVGGQRLTLWLPEVQVPTWGVDDLTLTVDAMALHLRVSSDEEYVTAALQHGPRELDLGNRAHHYLLLTLARARLRDRQEHRSEGECGWIYQEELCRMLDMDDKHINVAVFRLREQVSACGVLDAAAIIERRKPTRQLRVGLAQVQVESI